MFLIPAIDLIGGTCVRLRQGDYGEATTYSDDPVAVALEFEAAGADWLHVVDLDGAKAGHPVNGEVIGRLCRESGLRVEVGGGIRTAEDVRKTISAGAARAIMGSALTVNPEESYRLFEEFGDRLVAGIDTKSGRAATHGWQDSSIWDGLELAELLALHGCRRVIFTDISRDGELAGPNVEETIRWVERLPIPVVASGGVASEADLSALAQAGCEAVIVGKAIYEGRIDLASAIKNLKKI